MAASATAGVCVSNVAGAGVMPGYSPGMTREGYEHPTRRHSRRRSQLERLQDRLPAQFVACTGS